MSCTITNSTLFEFNDSISVIMMILISTLLIHFLLGFSLNCYIIFLLLPRGGGVNISVVFTLNYAAAEILFSISSLLYFVLLVVSDDFVDVLLNFLLGTSMSARLLFLCCVSLEHYLAVVHPVTFLRLKPLRYRVACSVVVWICALVLGTGVCILLSPYQLLAFVLLIVLAMELFCCVLILRRLRDPGPRDMRREQGEMNAAKKKAFQIVFINLLTCFVQNIPIVVAYGLVNFLPKCSVSYMADAISTVVNIIAGFVQPLCILHKAGKLSFIRCS